LVGQFQGQPITALAGVSFTRVVATFTADSTTDLSSSIAWGDGQTSAGAILPEGGTLYAIAGSSTYSQPGSYPVSVTVASLAGSSQTVTATATVGVYWGRTLGSAADGGAYFGEGSDAPSLNVAATGAVDILVGNTYVSVVVTLVQGNGAVTLPVLTSARPPTAGATAPAQPPGSRPVVGASTASPGNAPAPAVSASEQVAWANLHEQQPPPSLSPAPAPALVRGATAAQGTLVLLPPDGVAVQDAPNPTAPLLSLMVGSLFGDRTAFSTAPESRAAAKPDADALETPVVSGPDGPQESAPAGYQRPLYQVADRSELSGFPAGLPYRLGQEATPVAAVSLVPPPAAEPSHRETEAETRSEAAGQSGRKGGSLLSRPIRPWLMAATACVLQALHFSFFRTTRPPTLGKGEKRR
jgi:hypothetical protein